MSRRTERIIVAAAVLVTSIVAMLLRSTEWLASLGGRVTGARLERIRRSPQFSAGKFRNAEPTRMTTASMREMARRQFFGGEQREPLGIVPVVHRKAQDYASPPRSGLRATWIGWSSVLIEIDGRRFLTDPVWSERCSPSTLAGPKRFHPPPIALEELPSIDAVVISIAGDGAVLVRAMHDVQRERVTRRTSTASSTPPRMKTARPRVAASEARSRRRFASPPSDRRDQRASSSTADAISAKPAKK